jgi:hypothetical protein
LRAQVKPVAVGLIRLGGEGRTNLFLFIMLVVRPSLRG